MTRPGRIVADLLDDHVDPAAVGQIAGGAIDRAFEYPSVIAQHFARHAGRFGFRPGDGAALLDHLLVLAGYKNGTRVMAGGRDE